MICSEIIVIFKFKLKFQMLNLKGKKPKPTDQFRIPFSCPEQYSTLIEYYPFLVEELDGSCVENCLLFYYEKSITSSIYEFKDEDSELDMADILGINISIIQIGESVEDNKSRLMDEFIDENVIFEEPDKQQDIVDIISKKNQTKEAKKERRNKRLQEKEMKATTDGYL